MSNPLTQLTKQTLVAAAMIAFSSTALASGRCTSKEFEPTAAQKALYGSAARAMRTALLLPPEGWTMDPPTIRVPSNEFCGDFKNDPVTFGASTNYSIHPTADEMRRYRVAQQAEKKELDALKVLPPDLQAQIDSLDTQLSARHKEGRDAQRAKDAALAKSKLDEGIDLRRKSDALRIDYTQKIKPQFDQVLKKYEKEQKLNRSHSIGVSIEANGPRETDGDADRVVFGAANAKTIQSTDKLVRLLVRFGGRGDLPAQHMETVKKLVDRAKLQALIGGKIPSIEESQGALAEQSAAVTAHNARARERRINIEREGDREDEAAQMAKRQAAEAERAKPQPPAQPSAVATSTPTSAAATSTSAMPPTVPPAPAATPPKVPPPTPPATDAVKDAKDTVNKLRGLFGK